MPGMIQALATLLLPVLVIHTVLMGVGVVTGIRLRLIFPELDRGGE